MPRFSPNWVITRSSRPALATGEVLHARMRKGQANTQRGARRFIEELVARVRRAGASGEMVCRFDSGFWSKDTIVTLGRLEVRYTMAGRTNTKEIASAISAIDEITWVGIDYTPDGEAQVAECDYQGRRTRLTDTAQARQWPDWRHHAFLTDLNDDTITIDTFHRQHAVVEHAGISPRCDDPKYWNCQTQRVRHPAYLPR